MSARLARPAPTSSLVRPQCQISSVHRGVLFRRDTSVRHVLVRAPNAGASSPSSGKPPLVNPAGRTRVVVCPTCQGTGKKPCGQCEGTGVNQEDKFGGSAKKGDACWLCEGVAKTMCGDCVDLTDEF